MKVQGKYFDGLISREIPAELVASGNEISILLPEEYEEFIPAATNLESMLISSRLDSVPRSLRFPSGQQFLCEDNDAIDAMLEDSNLQVKSTIAHRLESYLPLVVLSVFFIFAAGFAFVRFGVPAIANETAKLVPPSIEIAMGEGVLEEMTENGLLLESQIEETSQSDLRQYLISLSPPDSNVTIVFRDSHLFGANAFALPGGTIVFTDELIKLVDYEEELLAIYLHELGHVKHKHLLKQGLQQSLLTLFIVSVTGDATAATDLVSLLPTLLISLNYSREFETESDQYALDQLEHLETDPAYFANIMRKLMGAETTPNSFFISSKYLSTHPAPDERLSHIGDFETLPEVENYIALFVDENVARFEGDWATAIFSDIETDPNGRACTYGEATVAINDGQIAGQGLSQFEQPYSLSGSVSAQGAISWHGVLENGVTLEFEGTLKEDSGEGIWWTFYPEDESLSGCEGTWVIKPKPAT